MASTINQSHVTGCQLTQETGLQKCFSCRGEHFPSIPAVSRDSPRPGGGDVAVPAEVDASRPYRCVSPGDVAMSRGAADTP